MSLLRSGSIALVTVVGLASTSSGEGKDPSRTEGPRVWIDAPEEVSLGVPFELRVGVSIGAGERVSVAPPSSTLALRIGAPLAGPGSSDAGEVLDSEAPGALGWWTIACVAGEQTLPVVDVTGWSTEDRAERWTAITPPRTIRVIGTSASARDAALRTGLAWLPETSTSTSIATWAFRGALLFLLLFAISKVAARIRVGSARALDSATRRVSTGSAARVAERALKDALQGHLRGELTAGEARDAAAHAVRVFVGCLAGVQGLAQCADELDLALRIRGDRRLADGVSLLVRESERGRYAAPTAAAKAHGDDLRAAIEAALHGIESARIAAAEPTSADAARGGNR